MKSRRSNRRRFLKNSAAMAGLAVGAMRSAVGQTRPEEPKTVAPATIRETGMVARDFRAYGMPSRFEISSRVSQASAALKTPLQDLHGIITPSGLHFTVAGLPGSLYGLPDIDPKEHRLLIHGLVDRPLVFTLEDLKRLPSITRIYFLECAGNSREGVQPKGRDTRVDSVQRIHGRTSCSQWTGVPLSLLLKETGLKKGATWLIGEGAEADHDRESIPIEKAMDDVLVAYGQNGEALRREQGYPMRLIVPGWEGQSNIKWLRRIKVVDEPYMDKGESTTLPDLRLDGKARWFRKVMEPKSVITRPSGGQRLPGRGFYEITGLAWSGGGAIRRVEVSTDGGRTWKDAKLQDPVLRFAHTRFVFPWNWNGDEVVLQSRCTDERGYVQPTLAELLRTWGIDLDYLRSPSAPELNHFVYIQPWKITGDGSVQNALV